MGANGSSRGWRSVKDQSRFESQLDPGFAAEVAAIPGGIKLHECIQCGTCSAVCPMSAYMDFTPRRMIAMTRAGVREDVLGSLAVWVCTSCYACTIECPKQIPITEIVKGLRRISMAEGLYPKRFTTPVMTREFVSMIRQRGRSTESWISMKLYLKTRPLQLLKYGFLAIGLMRRGRLSLGQESIRNPSELTTMLKALEATAPERAPVAALAAAAMEAAA